MKQNQNGREDAPQNNSLPKTHSKQNKNIVIAVMAVVIAALLFLCMRGFGKNPVGDPSQIDGTGDVQTGTIDIIADEDGRDLQAEVNQAVEDGMFNVFMNTEIYMENSKSKANLLIQNAKSNEKSVIVELYLQDGGDMIYRSDLIPAGSKIESAQLDKELSKGVYPCVAYFNILDPDTEELINRVGVNVQVEVDS